MEKRVVKTTCGHLRGSIQRSIEDYDYLAFKGVPYAKPPVGDLRFQDPQPSESWTVTRDATKFGPACAQFDQFEQIYIGSDDCLYLNVYVRLIEGGTRLPVMMWIHGGAYTFGSGDDKFYGPDYLLKKDIILVTVNYRLGVFGFLNLEDEAAPGNQGLKDQVMALKWIQANISEFGGDPSNITVFGESTGGSSVTYLSLSPMSKDLFHKAISQSGVAMNTWVSPPNPKRFAYRLCKYFGKETQDPEEIVEFLKTIDCLELAKASEKMRTPEERLQSLYPFGPGIDSKSTNPIMPTSVVEAAKSGIKIPYLLGYNNREGIYISSALRKVDYKQLDQKFEKYVHPNLIESLRERNVSLQKLRMLYNYVEVTKDNYIENFIDLFGDMYIVKGCHELIKLLALQNLASIYLYEFTYDKGTSISKLLMNITMRGASHFDELPYLFRMRFCETFDIKSLRKGSEDYKLMEQITEMWTNFAKTGNPTPVVSTLITREWAPISNPTHFNYMKIGSVLSNGDILSIEQRLSDGKNQ